MESFDDLPRNDIAFSVWSKDARCADSLMIIISGRSSCWLSRPAASCWSPG